MLTRASVTVASRIMLPAYIALAAAYGAVFAFDPGNRLASSHALDFPRKVMGGDVAPWGWLFLALSLILTATLRQGSRNAYVFGLCTCAAAWFAWGLMYEVSIFTDPQTSLLAPVAPLFYFTASIASARSLLARET